MCPKWWWNGFCSPGPVGATERRLGDGVVAGRLARLGDEERRRLAGRMARVVALEVDLAHGFGSRARLLTATSTTAARLFQLLLLLLL